MRISDWSSDVCSSDLGAGSAGDGGRGLPCGWPVLASSARRYAETSRAPNVTSMATPSDLIEPDWDVLVDGRSYAGLSAALNLGRARRSVLAAGSGPPSTATVHQLPDPLPQAGPPPGPAIPAHAQD